MHPSHLQSSGNPRLCFPQADWSCTGMHATKQKNQFPILRTKRFQESVGHSDTNSLQKMLDRRLSSKACEVHGNRSYVARQKLPTYSSDDIYLNVISVAVLKLTSYLRTAATTTSSHNAPKAETSEGTPTAGVWTSKGRICAMVEW